MPITTSHSGRKADLRASSTPDLPVNSNRRVSVPAGRGQCASCVVVPRLRSAENVELSVEEGSEPVPAARVCRSRKCGSRVATGGTGGAGAVHGDEELSCDTAARLCVVAALDDEVLVRRDCDKRETCVSHHLCAVGVHDRSRVGLACDAVDAGACVAPEAAITTAAGSGVRHLTRFRAPAGTQSKNRHHRPELSHSPTVSRCSWALNVVRP
jgi:hypothetical protein